MSIVVAFAYPRSLPLGQPAFTHEEEKNRPGSLLGRVCALGRSPFPPRPGSWEPVQTLTGTAFVETTLHASDQPLDHGRLDRIHVCLACFGPLSELYPAPIVVSRPPLLGHVLLFMHDPAADRHRPELGILWTNTHVQYN